MRKSSRKSPTPYWKGKTSFHFSIGLVLSLTLVTMAFEWNFPHKLQEDPIILPSSKTDQPEMTAVLLPVPPRPKVPAKVTEVPNDTDIAHRELKTEPKAADLIKSEPVPDLDDLLPGKPVEKADEPDYQTFPAEPKGGYDAFHQYLYNNISYPDHLVNRNRAGKIFVQFEVDEYGNISNIKILKGFDRSLEKEIIRVLKNAPAWEPAIQGNKRIRTLHQIPFSFDIE